MNQRESPFRSHQRQVDFHNELSPGLTLDDDGTERIVAVPESCLEVGFERCGVALERVVVDRDGGGHIRC